MTNMATLKGTLLTRVSLSFVYPMKLFFLLNFKEPLLFVYNFYIFFDLRDHQVASIVHFQICIQSIDELLKVLFKSFVLKFCQNSAWCVFRYARGINLLGFILHLFNLVDGVVILELNVSQLVGKYWINCWRFSTFSLSCIFLLKWLGVRSFIIILLIVFLLTLDDFIDSHVGSSIVDHSWWSRFLSWLSVFLSC
jgi:hypothetical protein